MYKLVLFDFDGTTIDTDLVIILTFIDLYKKYNPKKIPCLGEIVTFSGPPIRETLIKEFGEEQLKDSFIDFQDLSWNYYDKYLLLYPGAKDVFDSLKNQGIKIGIVTSKNRRASMHCLDVLKLNDYFDVIVTFDDVKECKPSPDGLLKACADFSLNPQECLYVGDANTDYLAAKNAKMDFMMVTWGPRKISKDISPKYFLDSFDEFFEVIRNGK